MALFHGELHMEGDSDRLPAVVKVELGSLTLSSGRTELGSWKLYEVRILDLGDRAVLSADEENVVLYLSEHGSFVGEVERFVQRPDDKKRRRRRRSKREHPAFEATGRPSEVVEPRAEKVRIKPEKLVDDQGPAEPKEPVGAALRAKLAERAAPVAADTRRFLQRVNPGRVVWGAVAVFVITLVFLPNVLALVLAVAGMFAMAIGVIAYSDSTIAARFPNRFPPVRLILGGGVAVVVGILIAVLR